MVEIFSKKSNPKKGYTIIETMIAISLFLIITMAGMGALLNANLLQSKSEDMRSSLDSLNFILEDMSRNLRVGHDYRCISGKFSAGDVIPPQSCLSGGAIAFENDLGDPQSADDQWVYKIESPDGILPFNIYKSTEGGADGTFVQLNPDEVEIDPTSFFKVVGAEPPPDTSQPLVTIKLTGTITSKGITTPFTLQTSVSQRVIDI